MELNYVIFVESMYNYELVLIDENFNDLRYSLVEVKSILEMLINKYKHLNILLNHRYD
jgi:ATP:corrinoid adenosyltransferase